MKNLAIFLAVITTQVYAQSNIDNLFLKKINQFRAQNGKTTVIYDDALDSAAHWHSRWMKQYQQLSHSEHFYHTTQQRIEKYDMTAFIYNRYDKYLVKENIIKVGYYSNSFTADSLVDRVFTAWLNSPPHREAILADWATNIGFGEILTVTTDPTFPIKHNQVWATLVITTTNKQIRVTE